MKYLTQNIKIIVVAISIFIFSVSAGILIYKYSGAEYSPKASIFEIDHE